MTELFWHSFWKAGPVILLLALYREARGSPGSTSWSMSAQYPPQTPDGGASAEGWGVCPLLQQIHAGARFPASGVKTEFQLPVS